MISCITMRYHYRPKEREVTWPSQQKCNTLERADAGTKARVAVPRGLLSAATIAFSLETRAKRKTKPDRPQSITRNARECSHLDTIIARFAISQLSPSTCTISSKTGPSHKFPAQAPVTSLLCIRPQHRRRGNPIVSNTPRRPPQKRHPRPRAHKSRHPIKTHIHTHSIDCNKRHHGHHTPPRHTTSFQHTDGHAAGTSTAQRF